MYAYFNLINFIMYRPYVFYNSYCMPCNCIELNCILSIEKKKIFIIRLFVKPLLCYVLHGTAICIELYGMSITYDH